MLTLTLLRHAKSNRDDPDLDDVDRPLTRRGEKAVPRMGAYMAAHGIQPELIVCSSARRAHDTLTLLLPALGGAPRVEIEAGLYLASPAAILRRLAEVGETPKHVMVVGHNPGLHALALDLISQGRREDIAELGRNLPTAGLVVVNFNLKSWRLVRPALGTLRLFVRPAEVQ